MTVKKAGIAIWAALVMACNSSEQKEATPTGSPAADPSISRTAAGNRWDEKDRTLFMQKCIDGSAGKMTEARAKAYCTCMLQKLEAKYPVADSTANISLAEMTQLAKGCLQ